MNALTLGQFGSCNDGRGERGCGYEIRRLRHDSVTIAE